LVYYRQSKTYPDGAYVVTVGDKFVLYRDDWEFDMPQTGGKKMPEVRDIPLAQMRWLDDHVDNDPYGLGPLETLGPMDEIRASIVGSMLEYWERFNRPREFVPFGSTLTAEYLAGMRDGKPVQYNAEAGTPVFEAIPPYPPIGEAMLQFITGEMNTAVGLEQAAQGVSTPEVKSGLHARTIIEQALVALSGTKRGSDKCGVRLCRLVLQAMRADYSVPQRMQYVGEDGAYKEREWTGADLGSTKDVQIARGTSTMMAMSAKAQLAREELQIALNAGDRQAYQRYQRVMAGNVSTTLGLQDDPATMRVKRQIMQWEQGPGPDLVMQSQQREVMLSQQPPAQVDPQTGQPVPIQAPPDPMAQAAASIFAPRPTDEEQAVALVRHQELARAIEGTKFESMPPAWQAGLVQAYDQARKAAGLMTLTEQSQAQQAQTQQQLQQEVQKEQAKAAAKTQGQIAADQAQTASQARLSLLPRVSQEVQPVA
jgi:hypothetical protein